MLYNNKKTGIIHIKIINEYNLCYSFTFIKRYQSL